MAFSESQFANDGASKSMDGFEQFFGRKIVEWEDAYIDGDEASCQRILREINSKLSNPLTEAQLIEFVGAENSTNEKETNDAPDLVKIGRRHVLVGESGGYLKNKYGKRKRIDSYRDRKKLMEIIRQKRLGVEKKKRAI